MDRARCSSGSLLAGGDRASLASCRLGDGEERPQVPAALRSARRSREQVILRALGSYGVPIESVACESVAELARRLGGEHAQA